MSKNIRNGSLFVLITVVLVLSSCIKVKTPDSNLVAKVGNTLIFDRDLELVESSLEGCFPEYENKINNQTAFVILFKSLIASQICENWGCNISKNISPQEINKAKKDCNYPQILDSLFESNNNLLLKDYVIPRLAIKKLFLYVYSSNPKANIDAFNKAKKFLSMVSNANYNEFKRLAKRKNVRLFHVAYNRKTKVFTDWQHIGKVFPYGNPVSTYEKIGKYINVLLKAPTNKTINKIYEQHGGFEILLPLNNKGEEIEYVMAYFPKQSWEEFFTKEANKINIFVYYPDYEEVINKIPLLQGINIIYK